MSVGLLGLLFMHYGIKRVRQTPEKIFRTQVLVHRGFELYAFRTKALTVIKDRRVNFDIINFRPQRAIFAKMPV
jgi:hypothetical protein